SLAMDRKVPLPKELASEKRWKDLPSPKRATLLEIAKYALEKAIPKLDKGTKFNIVGVSESKRFWKRKGEKARGSMISSALSFIKRLRTKPGFDLYGALKNAFNQQKDWDTIYLLCTSLPRGGYYSTATESLPHIYRLLLPSFATLRVRGLLVLPGAGYDQISKLKEEEKVEKIRNFYKDLSQHSYGSYQEISFVLKKSSSVSTGRESKKKKEPFEIKRDKGGRIPYDEWNRIRKKVTSLLSYPKDMEEVKDVLEKVASSNDPRCVELVVQKVLSKDKPDFIFAAIQGLQKTSKPKAVEKLVQLLNRERSSRIRLLLLQVLSRLKGEKVEKALMRVARGKDPKEVCFALQGLMKIGTKRSVNTLKKWARNKKEGLLAYYASLALQKITGSGGPSEVKNPQSFLPKPRSTHVVFALSLSETMGDPVEISKEEYKK
ncbi:MAG: hypothetical protein D6785_04765, partial [Planctomycetota bacterium]